MRYHHIFIILLVSFVIALYSCHSEEATTGAATTRDSLMDDSEPTPVMTQKIDQQLYVHRIQSTGKIQATYEQRIYAEEAGRIINSTAKNGATYSKDEIIAQLDQRATSLKLERAEEAVFNAQIDYESDLLSQVSFLDDKRPGAKDTILRKLRANSGLTEAELNMKEAQLELEKLSITAPITGKLFDVTIQEGTYIKPGDELFAIYSHNELLLEAKILEGDIEFVKIGQSATVAPISGTAQYQASVVEVNPIVDEHGMVMIRLRLSNPTGLIPGMNASAVIEAPQREALIIPKSAVVMRNGRAIVFTVEDGLAKWNYVTLGDDNGESIQIVDGLTIGQNIIYSNNLQLVHDAPVREVVSEEESQ